jgi:hypothetical protein
MVADIRNVDDDIEVRRFADLTRTYRQRLAVLARTRERLVMADSSVDDLAERAAAMIDGTEYIPPRSLASIGDEEAVLRRAIARTEDAERDAHARAAVAISRECRLPEQASKLRENIAVAIDNLLAAMAASDRFADRLEQAGISAAGERWPGCGEPAIIESLAGLRIDLGGTDAATLLMLERRAGIRVEPAFVLQDRPAPAAVKQTIRKRVSAALDEIGVQMIG